MSQNLSTEITRIWENRENGVSKDDQFLVMKAIRMMDNGEAGVIERNGDEYTFNEYLKFAILLMFKISKNEMLFQSQENVYYDKVPSKFKGWTDVNFTDAGIRVLPSSWVRISAQVQALAPFKYRTNQPQGTRPSLHTLQFLSGQ